MGQAQIKKLMLDLSPGEVYSMVGCVLIGLVAVAAVAIGGGGTEKFGGRFGRLAPLPLPLLNPLVWTPSETMNTWKKDEDFFVLRGFDCYKKYAKTVHLLFIIH